MTVHEYIRVIEQGEHVEFCVCDWIGRAIAKGSKEHLLSNKFSNIHDVEVTHVRFKSTSVWVGSKNYLRVEIDTELD